MDKLEERYTLVSGGCEQLSDNEDKFIGLRKGDVTFEGLILRENADKYFTSLSKSKPNIESFLTYSIWGNR